MKTLLLIIVLIAILLASCSPQKPTLPDTPSTHTPTSTLFSTPAKTATPTFTLTPTATATQTPDIPEYFVINPETLELDIIPVGFENAGSYDLGSILEDAPLLEGNHYLIVAPWFTNAPTSIIICADPLLLQPDDNKIAYTGKNVEVSFYDPFTLEAITNIPLERVGNTSTFCSQELSGDELFSITPFEWNKYGLIGISIEDQEIAIIDFNVFKLTTGSDKGGSGGNSGSGENPGNGDSDNDSDDDWTT